MTKQELFELGNKIDAFISEELKDKPIGDVAAATILVLSYHMSEMCGDIVLPETACMNALIKLNALTKGCNCK